MVGDTVTPSGGGEIMAALDAEGDAARLIIADVSAEGTWLSVLEESAASLAEWR